MTRALQLEAFADAVHDLLHARAMSIGAIDVAVDVNDHHVDGEVLFGDGGPDMGFTFDSQASACAYCELVPPDAERWLDEHALDLAVPQDDEACTEAALVLLRGLLDARRPLL